MHVSACFYFYVGFETGCAVKYWKMEGKKEKKRLRQGEGRERLGGRKNLKGTMRTERKKAKVDNLEREKGGKSDRETTRVHDTKGGG